MKNVVKNKRNVKNVLENVLTVVTVTLRASFRACVAGIWMLRQSDVRGRR